MYLTNENVVFLVFLDLKNDYDTIDRLATLQIVRMSGIDRKLLKSMQSFHADSWECVSL